MRSFTFITFSISVQYLQNLKKVQVEDVEWIFKDVLEGNGDGASPGPLGCSELFRRLLKTLHFIEMVLVVF